MDILIHPSKLNGSVRAVSSKSHVQRLAIASALSDRTTIIGFNGMSGDIRSCLNAIRCLGADYTVKNGQIVIKPIKRKKRSVEVFCGESGTTARIILPVMTAIYSHGELDGTGSLLMRPFDPICRSLEKNGCHFLSYSLPIRYEGSINGGEYYIDASTSSQYVSGLKFALPLLGEDSKIILLNETVSKEYINMTEAVLSQFCISSGNDVKGRQEYISPGEVIADGDWSDSSFWLAAGISVTGLDEDSLQMDKAFKSLIGKDIIDVTDVPDLLPPLAVWCVGNGVVCHFLNTGRLRNKESDRVASTVELIRSLGGEAHSDSNSLTIDTAGTISGGIVDSHGDHRIAMAAAVASVYSKGDIIIKGADSVNKSYPDFFADFTKLGGEANVI